MDQCRCNCILIELGVNNKSLCRSRYTMLYGLDALAVFVFLSRPKVQMLCNLDLYNEWAIRSQFSRSTDLPCARDIMPVAFIGLWGIIQTSVKSTSKSEGLVSTICVINHKWALLKALTVTRYVVIWSYLCHSPRLPLISWLFCSYYSFRTYVDFGSKLFRIWITML